MSINGYLVTCVLSIDKGSLSSFWYSHTGLEDDWQTGVLTSNDDGAV